MLRRWLLGAWRRFSLREHLTDMDDKIVLRAVETGEDCCALGARSARECAEALEAVDVQPQASWWIHEI